MNEKPMEPSAVKFSRLPQRGVLLGLSVSQLVALACALVPMVVALYAAGGTGALLVAPWSGLWLAAMLVPVAGRKAIQWAPIAISWTWRGMTRQLAFRRSLSRPRPAGTLALPGDAAALRHYVDTDTGAVMVHDPHRSTLTAVLDVAHPSFALLDPAEQDRRTVLWGRVLASVCRSGRIARLQVVERTLPDSGTGLAEWWKKYGTDDGSWVASTYRELVERAGPAGERHVSTIALCMDMKLAGRAIRSASGGMRGAAYVLRKEMNTLVTALRSADLEPSDWYSPQTLAGVLRAAYDPAVAARLERTQEVGRDLAAAGPVAVDEAWGHLRSDSGYHCVLWLSEWPRSLVYPGFLSPVLMSSGIRRSFSILHDPVRADAAARDLRRKKTEHIADAAQRAKIGQVEDAMQRAEFDDVLQQEAELTAGHGVLRYTGLISLSAPDLEELEAAVATIEQAAIQASCETRRLVGQQAQAFTVAALPLARAL